MAKLNLDVEKAIKEYKGEEKQGKSLEGLWQEQDLAVKAGEPLVDSATGKRLVIRVFDYKFDPKMTFADIQRVKENRQEFFNQHAKYIRNFLWKDGLAIREDHDPRMLFTKKGYRIAVLCEARLGLGFDKKGTTLQNILSKYNKKNAKTS